MFDQLPGFIWLDGEIIDWKDAKCHIMTHALHYASSVYEGLRSYNGNILKPKEHYDRFHKSAAYLNFEIPYFSEELIKATQLLVDKGHYKDGYIRAISWCGSKVMTVSHRNADVHTAIAIWERPINYPEHFYTKGIKMNIAQWRRPDPSTAPVHSKAAGLYMISSLSKKSSEVAGFDDALMLDHRGNIAEATSSNIFFVIDGKLCTPPPTCFLNGITRLTCIDIARKLGIEVQERIMTLDDLSSVSEAFLTGTAIEILPVGSIEDAEHIWAFQPAVVTSVIRSEFQNIKNKLQEEQYD